MSQSIRRGLRRLEDVQYSRSVAWIVFVVMLPIAFYAFVAVVTAVQSGAFVSASGIISVVVLISAVWVAIHMLREVRRLGKLIRNPERLMRPERDPELVSGIHWSGFLPFSGWRE